MSLDLSCFELPARWKYFTKPGMEIFGSEDDDDLRRRGGRTCVSDSMSTEGSMIDSMSGSVSSEGSIF